MQNMTDTDCESGSAIYTQHNSVPTWNHPRQASRTYHGYRSLPIDRVIMDKMIMDKIPDAKEAQTIVSVSAKAKLTTARPIWVPFAIINNNPSEVDIIPFHLSIDQCSLGSIIL